MRRMVALALGALFAALLYGIAVADQPAPAGDAKAKPSEGQGVFTKYKCRSCHSVESQGITKKATEGEKEEDTGGVKPPDLSGVGLVRDVAWMTKFLTKEEKIEGKLHPKKFRGTAPELQKLTAWLATLKDEAAAKKMKANETSAAKAADAKEDAKEDATKGGK